MSINDEDFDSIVNSLIELGWVKEVGEERNVLTDVGRKLCISLLVVSTPPSSSLAMSEELINAIEFATLYTVMAGIKVAPWAPGNGVPTLEWLEEFFKNLEYTGYKLVKIDESARWFKKWEVLKHSEYQGGAIGIVGRPVFNDER